MSIVSCPGKTNSDDKNATGQQIVQLASFPGLPRFFVLWFAFSIIHGSGRLRKTGKAWSHPSREWRQVDARWTQKLGDQPQKQGTGSYVRALYRTSGLKTLAWSKLLTFTGKKLAFEVYSLHFLNIISSPGVHSHDGWDQAFLVFRALPLPCIILNANRRTKNGGGLGTRLQKSTARN